jgi:hypothetical protein
LAWHHFASTVTGSLLLLCVPKPSHYFHYFFSETIVLGIVTVRTKDCMTQMVKLHLKKLCIQYNYTMFIWVIYSNQKKWTILVPNDA